mmetsp:Transcript_10157/g.18296  ORF Transcript_10157/g.18296 Transcript_10157/m.18296 type:complete len:142 (-) Transcript_10157:102-527(-)
MMEEEKQERRHESNLEVFDEVEEVFQAIERFPPGDLRRIPLKLKLDELIEDIELKKDSKLDSKCDSATEKNEKSVETTVNLVNEKNTTQKATVLQVIHAQKCLKNSLSALDFQDLSTAVSELEKAMQILNSQQRFISADAI